MLNCYCLNLFKELDISVPLNDWIKCLFVNQTLKNSKTQSYVLSMLHLRYKVKFHVSLFELRVRLSSGGARDCWSFFLSNSKQLVCLAKSWFEIFDGSFLVTCKYKESLKGKNTIRSSSWSTCFSNPRLELIRSQLSYWLLHTLGIQIWGIFRKGVVQIPKN